jgi:hypothetical protein
LYIFVGPTASATTATAFSIAAGSFFNCTNQNGLVITDNLAVTAATSTHAFVGISQ